MVKKILLIIVLIVLFLSSIACQTVSGMGGDIKWTAEKTAEMLEGQ